MKAIFFTGYPGFLGAELLPRVLTAAPDHRAVCLVQSKFAGLARQRAQELTSARPEFEGRIDIVEGDITKRNVGLGSPGGLRNDVDEIYHLAAVYDLGVRREVGMLVNVEGTKRMLEFAAECPSLRRFQYVSTCYVSGVYPGEYKESDLDKGQRFNNYYEETKFLAEVEVQKCMREGLRATVYRPAIVVGDSRTGATQKYDGPYCIMRLLLRQPKLAVLPTVGDLKAEVNLVPRDFVVDSIAYLSARPESEGKVFQLADPRPLTAGELVTAMAHATGRKVMRIPLPLGLAKWSLQRVPGVEALLQIPPETLHYFVHPARYGTENSQAALKAGGIRCPRLPEYLDTLVKFVRAHPEIGTAAMA